MRNFTWILSGLLLPLLSIGQQPAYPFRNISINQGLSQSSVVDIAIDSAGFVWMATQDGLNRFDGKTFISYPKNFDDITTLSRSQLGRIVVPGKEELWLITSNGRWEVLNLYTGRFSEPVLPKHPAFPANGITALLPDGDDTWIGTATAGLFRFTKTTQQWLHFSDEPFPSLSNRTVQDIFKDSRGTYWILTDSGVTSLRREKQFIASYDPLSADSKVGCSAIAEDRDGNLWLGTFGHGLYTKKRNENTFTVFAAPMENLPADLVTESLLVDNENRLWIGSYEFGVYILDLANGKITNLRNNKQDPYSLAYDDVLRIRQTKSGGIWVGTDGGGVSYHDHRLNNFKSLTRYNTPANIPMEQVRSITTDPAGDIWIGMSQKGLTYVRKDLSKPEPVILPLPKDDREYDRIVSLYGDDNFDIWIGLQGKGLILLDSRQRSIKKVFGPTGKGTDFFPDHTVWSILPAGKNRIWAATRNGGLCLVDKNAGVIQTINQHTHGNPLLENSIRSMTIANDSLIILGFETKGVQFLNTRTGRLSLPQEKVFRQMFSQPTTIRSLHFQTPTLWIGTYGKGIMGVNITTGETVKVTDKEGLPNNTVYGILADEEGVLWMSTNKGICRFRVPGSYSEINRTCFYDFTSEDGLQSNEFNTGAYHRAVDGRLLFGGINGLTVFQPDLVVRKHAPVPLVFTKALVDNQPIDIDTLITYKNQLSLRHDQHSISFTFAAVDLVLAERMNYFYKLSGYDKQWIYAGNRNYAAYTNLPPGHYQFMVRASRDLDASGQSMITLNIRIRPPFWWTWWFITACVIVVCLILYAFYRYRIKQLMRLQTIRNNIASDLHDDIGSTLTNISILSEVSRKKLNQQEEASVFLDRISEEVQHSGQALDDIVWSINTSNDTLEQTVARMRRYAAEVFDAAGINYVLDFDEKFSQRKINMEQRRDFLLLFKESVNNVYKHAGATHVHISTGIEKNRLFMRINDNGKGFDTKQPTHRNGIKNMEKRVARWDGFFGVASVPGKGTTTEFNFHIA